MNKRTFKRIQMLHEEGVSLETAITMIISLTKTATEGAQKVIEFYKKILPEAWGKEIANDPDSS